MRSVRFHRGYGRLLFVRHIFKKADMPQENSAHAGQAVYTPLTLLAYDWFVLGFSNRILWRCPTQHLEALYARNVSDRHIDIGVGTGYFLDKAPWPSVKPQITLVDLNPYSLAAAARRIERFSPQSVTANIFDPLPLPQTYDSAGICYLLHCLPGPMAEKAPTVFQNVANVLVDGGRVFGATILQGDAPRSFPAQKLMNFYNGKGVFSNEADDFRSLSEAFGAHFQNVKLERFGVVATFEGFKPTAPT